MAEIDTKVKKYRALGAVCCRWSALAGRKESACQSRVRTRYISRSGILANCLPSDWGSRSEVPR